MEGRKFKKGDWITDGVAKVKVDYIDYDKNLYIVSTRFSFLVIDVPNNEKSTLGIFGLPFNKEKEWTKI